MPGQLLVSDANVLIDMDTGGLLKAMFTLDYSFAVPDILFEEELKAQHPELPKLGLKCLELREDAVKYVAELAVEYERTGVSRNDLVALALASQEICPLLTGDSQLRKVCEDKKIQVQGTLWLIGQMLEQKVVGLNAAHKAYNVMRAEGRRLPWNEVTKQLKSPRKK